MNLTIVSAFRDEVQTGRLEKYLARLEALDWPKDALRFVWVEGDSADGTFDRLAEVRDTDSRITLVACDTGRPRYGSVVHPERFLVLATVFNAGLDNVDYNWSDWVVFLPGDITFGANTMTRLVTRAIEHRCDLLAPFVFQNGVFYDIWAFTIGGRSIGPFQQTEWQQWGGDPFRCDTVGGTLLMRREVPGCGIRYTVDDVDRGLCHTAAARGFSVYADPATHVFHGV